MNFTSETTSQSPELTQADEFNGQFNGCESDDERNRMLLEFANQMVQNPKLFTKINSRRRDMLNLEYIDLDEGEELTLKQLYEKLNKIHTEQKKEEARKHAAKLQMASIAQELENIDSRLESEPLTTEATVQEAPNLIEPLDFNSMMFGEDGLSELGQKYWDNMVELAKQSYAKEPQTLAKDWLQTKEINRLRSKWEVRFPDNQGDFLDWLSQAWQNRVELQRFENGIAHFNGWTFEVLYEDWVQKGDFSEHINASVHSYNDHRFSGNGPATGSRFIGLKVIYDQSGVSHDLKMEYPKSDSPDNVIIANTKSLGVEMTVEGAKHTVTVPMIDNLEQMYEIIQKQQWGEEIPDSLAPFDVMHPEAPYFFMNSEAVDAEGNYDEGKESVRLYVQRSGNLLQSEPHYSADFYIRKTAFNHQTGRTELTDDWTWDYISGPYNASHKTPADVIGWNKFGKAIRDHNMVQYNPHKDEFINSEIVVSG